MSCMAQQYMRVKQLTYSGIAKPLDYLFLGEITSCASRIIQPDWHLENNNNTTQTRQLLTRNQKETTRLDELDHSFRVHDTR